MIFKIFFETFGFIVFVMKRCKWTFDWICWLLYKIKVNVKCLTSIIIETDEKRINKHVEALNSSFENFLEVFIKLKGSERPVEKERNDSRLEFF